MYFDTLKVSTLEQTAEQASARGGTGNPELITWDFGKEITLTLEDALYTPASQSLMWGGKFGVKHSKIQGLWNPYEYPKDKFGRTLYLRKITASKEDLDYLEKTKEKTYDVNIEIDLNLDKADENRDNFLGFITGFYSPAQYFEDLVRNGVFTAPDGTDLQAILNNIKQKNKDGEPNWINTHGFIDEWVKTKNSKICEWIVRNIQNATKTIEEDEEDEGTSLEKIVEIIGQHPNLIKNIFVESIKRAAATEQEATPALKIGGATVSPIAAPTSQVNPIAAAPTTSTPETTTPAPATTEAPAAENGEEKEEEQQEKKEDTQNTESEVAAAQVEGETETIAAPQKTVEKLMTEISKISYIVKFNFSVFSKDEIEKNWVKFICPCDLKEKYMTYVPNNGLYKYLEVEPSEFECPKGYPTVDYIGKTANNGEKIYGKMVKSYYWNSGSNPIKDQLKGRIKLKPGFRPERAEITVDNFGKFDYDTYYVERTLGESYPKTDVVEIEKKDGNGRPYCVYKAVSQCNKILGSKASNCGENINAYGYNWRKTDLKMTSLEGNQDMYYTENASLRYRVPKDSTHKEIMIARQGLYPTEYKSETGLWEKSDKAEEVTDFVTLNRQNTPAQSYGWFENPYDSKVDFYMNVTWTIPDVGTNLEKPINHSTRVKVGTFYIVQDWNNAYETQYDLIHPIDSGIENVPVLDRMEKCKASQTFCIDTDRNLKMNNYRYMPEYAHTVLTVYINPKTMKPYEPNADTFTRKNGQIIDGNLRIIKQHEIYYKWTRSIAPPYTTLGHRIIVDATHFPGTYRLVGETYARSRVDGKDQRFQFEIPLCKMSADTNLTLEAAGDPTTFTMTMKALRREDGVMVKLTQYSVECDKYDGVPSGSTRVVPVDGPEPDMYDTYVLENTQHYMKITQPPDGTTYIMSKDHQSQEVTPEVALFTQKRSITEEYNINTLEVVNTETSDWADTNKEILNHEDYRINITHPEEANS